MGTGECAGEVVPPIEFDLAAAERQLFEAEVAFDGGHSEEAGKKAYHAMLQAARGLVKLEMPQVSDKPDIIVSEFRTRYYDTQKFWDPYAGGKFANYLFDAHRKANEPHNEDSEPLPDR